MFRRIVYLRPKISHRNQTDIFICVNLDDLAARVSNLMNDDEIERVAGVGNSGFAFARRVSGECKKIPVETSKFSKTREGRVLLVDQIKFETEPVLVDDLAVSGLTLSTVLDKVMPSPDVAVVGMLYNSKTTRKLIGVGDLRYGFSYSRIGGGRPPINSIETLWRLPERCGELALKYFSGEQVAFCTSIRNMENSL